MNEENTTMEPEMKELDALLEYIIKHNQEHAEEIKVLAQKATGINKTEVSDDLLNGVKKMNESNASLRRALDRLRGKER